MSERGPDTELQLCAAILAGHDLEVVEQVIRRLPQKPNLAVMVSMPGVPDVASRLQRVTAMPVTDVTETIIGDFTRLCQVLTNLLANATKYTPVRASSDGDNRGSTFTFEIPPANEG